MHTIHFPITQVAALAVQADKLYIGTSWGCLIVAEAASMRPITVFRPFSEELQSIVAVTEPAEFNLVGGGGGGSSAKSFNSDVTGSSPLIITLGKGYRNLIGRYVTDKRPSPSSGEDIYDDNSRTVYALLWRPDDWLSD